MALSQLVLIFLIFLFSSESLHLQSQQNIYDAEQYKQTLQQQQTQFKNDLLQIQTSFQQLDKQIQQAVNDPNEQLRILAQGMAEERDSLYSIQQYLSLPFNQRACQCFNFSDNLRANLTSKLQQLQQQLQQIKSISKQCAKCGMTLQIQNQLKIQSGYIKTMQDTLNAKCCKIYTILYVDNLNASNWYNGGFTTQDYKQWLNQQVSNIKNSSNNNTLLRVCPITNPYSSSNLSTCTQCPDSITVFNINSRTCEQCPIGKIFNYDKHTCDYNVICPENSQFNQKTVMCQQVQNPYNSSVCPPESPVWNVELEGCFKCSSSTPYYDGELGKCTTCPDNTTYNPNTNQCQNKQCLPSQFYSPSTHKCQPKPTNTPINDQLSSSLCPFSRPYWDKESLSCTRCLITRPYYNITSRQCEVCPGNSTYDRARSVCTIACAPGRQLNQATMQCQNITRISVIDNNNQVSLCPPSRPIWNPQTKSCSQCASSSPYWNTNSNQCQICPVGQILNNVTNKCQNQIQVNICPNNTVFNKIQGTCDKIGGTVGSCPPSRPYFNTNTLSCTQCPTELPYYNKLTGKCSANSQQQLNACPQNYYYDLILQKCALLINSSYKCPKSTPFWDSIRKACLACGDGLVWEANLQACIPCINGNCNININKTCGFNQQWVNNTCSKCKRWQKYNTSTLKCDSYCRPGQNYDSTLQICSGTVSRCPIGLKFDQSQLRCECPEGKNYKYNESNKNCSRVCGQRQQYHYLDGKCYPLPF